jgi:hypothetical protein
MQPARVMSTAELVRLPCIYCGSTPRISKSHIVPEYLYEFTCEDGQILAVDANLDQIGPLRQKGYYEPLLCARCDNRFNTEREQPCQWFFRE